MSGKAGLNRLNPESFFAAGICGRLEVAIVQELGVGGEMAIRGGDGHMCWSVFPCRTLIFSDGDTETLGRKKDLSHRILHRSFYSSKHFLPNTHNHPGELPAKIPAQPFHT